MDCIEEISPVETKAQTQNEFGMAKFSLNFEEEIDLEQNLISNQIKDFHN